MTEIGPVILLPPAAALLALFMAAFFARQMLRAAEGTERMIEIARHVRSGAMAYLRQQYRVMLLVFVVLAGVFALMAFVWELQTRWMPLLFLCGGFFSALAGYFGMRTATAASSRTAQAASESLGAGLQIAFRSGAVMGLVVVGLGLLNIGVWFAVLHSAHDGLPPGAHLVFVTTALLTFSMGASLQALFARVGGGIYTKAADVGADLVGKVEAGIPEDDPRNPAVIADNVGDNVGDVAGMGADLYESYVGCILAASALGASAYLREPAHQMAAVLAPMLVAALGIVLSIGGIFMVRTKEGASQKDLLKSLSRGINFSSILIFSGTLGVLWCLGLPNAVGLWLAVATGLGTGLVIGRATEYSTSSASRPTREIAHHAQGGAATLLIAGIASGMMSTVVPVLAVGAGIFLSFLFASGGDPSQVAHGLYGIALAAVGMLSTLGITLATDAYGPIADNAGGNAEMSGLGPAVRARTDALDSLGNTTAATGKGFAIGSAALTALALLASYIEVVRVELIKRGITVLELGHDEVPTAAAGLEDFMDYFHIHLLNPSVLVCIFLGAMTAFLFCGLTIQAVGRAAGAMVDEVRRQFREIPGILEGRGQPDYARCVAISTAGAQKEMVVPSLVAILVPVVAGLLFGVAGVIGLLVGALATGFTLAVFLANSGGAWDNAKKYIEEGHHGGKGSSAHKASVIGDTVGDPFKDTSGPSLNILIKLMSIVAIVMAGVTLAFRLF
ncbi:MAG: sodium-translocating pyrophosphatase [Chthoniobacterales bacterium]|nr:sodium-translocating pyrophosphatase [Chthoniobacterales bacterium]